MIEMGNAETGIVIEVKYTDEKKDLDDFFYKQYSELYCKLYAIIIQSEYVRHFIELTDKRNIPFEEAPFLEITPTHKETTTFNINKPAF